MGNTDEALRPWADRFLFPSINLRGRELKLKQEPTEEKENNE